MPADQENAQGVERTGPPSPAEMRDAGFSANAIQHPRDELALQLLCAFNGVQPAQAPRSWGYFPNPATQAAWKRVADTAAAYFAPPPLREEEREEVARLVTAARVEAGAIRRPGKWVPNRQGLADFIDKLADALSRLPPAPAEGRRLVPVEPPIELLVSMAVREDHGLGVPGYYDQHFFGATNVGHAKRLKFAIDTMRKLYEEVVGVGFYRPENAERYRAMLAAAHPEPNPSSNGAR